MTINIIIAGYIKVTCCGLASDVLAALTLIVIQPMFSNFLGLANLPLHKNLVLRDSFGLSFRRKMFDDMHVLKKFENCMKLLTLNFC